MSEFHFIAARITVAQICRSMGIERGNATVSDALTSIMLDYLTSLGTTAASASEGRGAKNADASDVMSAAVQCGAVKVRLSGDMDDNRDIEEFLKWIRGPSQKRMADIAKPNRNTHSQFAGTLNSAVSSSSPPLPNDTNQVEQTSASATTGSQPEGFNTTSSENAAAAKAPQAEIPNTEPSLPKDWLEAVVSRQSIMTHSDWTPGSSTFVEPDPTIYGR